MTGAFSMDQKKGRALFESSTSFGDKPQFFIVPARNEGDAMAALSIRRMLGRIIAFDYNLNTLGSNIYPLTEEKLYASDLIADGWTIKTTPTLPGLVLVPAERPVPNINTHEAERFYAICGNLNYYYQNYMIDSANDLPLDTERTIALFKNFDYTIDENMANDILEKKVPDLGGKSYSNRGEQRDFIHKVLSIPENLNTGLAHNADQITLYDQETALREAKTQLQNNEPEKSPVALIDNTPKADLRTPRI